MNQLARRSWSIRLALMASTLALLATSPGTVPRKSYNFERSVTGESVELTSDQPGASFLVTIRVETLGPDDVQSTGDATVQITGRLTSTGVDGNMPFVSVHAGDRKLEVLQSFDTTSALNFEGTCDAPAENAPCQATFSVELSRNDDGTQGGSVNVDWSFELTSRGELEGEGADESGLDPPWSVEIARQ